MKFHEMFDKVSAAGDSALRLKLPSGESVPEHFHVTEVGRVAHHFIDCGGTQRASVVCLVQAWTAHDVDHRLRASKFAIILTMVDDLYDLQPLDVEFEYEAGLISQYKLVAVESDDESLTFVLENKHTECLAPDKCGVSVPCCAGEKCC